MYTAENRNVTCRKVINFSHKLFIMAQQPQSAKASSLSRIHDHTRLDTPHSVGLLWTSDQAYAETST